MSMQDKKFKLDNKSIREAARIELSNKVIQVCSKHLTSLEWEVLTKVFLDNQSFAEIAEKRQLTSGRIKQIFEKGVRRTMVYLTSIDEKAIGFKEAIKEHDKIVAELESYQKKEEENKKEAKVLEFLSPKVQKLLKIKIADTDLSARVKNICEKGNVWGEGAETIEDLIRVGKKEFLKFRNCGKKSVEEIEFFFNSNELSWDLLNMTHKNTDKA